MLRHLIKQMAMGPRMFAILVVGLAFGLPLTAQAVAVSPAITQKLVEPGKTITGTIQVMNDEAQAQEYVVSVQNFIPRGEDGQQDFLPESNRLGLVSWLTLNVSSVQLQPHETREVVWTLVVPPDARPGGYSAVVFFSSHPSGAAASVGVTAKTGVLLFVNVAGAAMERAQIDSMQISPDGRWLNQLPGAVEVRIRNEGSTNLRPEGKVVLLDMIGRSISDTPLNSAGALLLPGSTRHFDVARSTDASSSTHGFFEQLQGEWRNFGLGRYTATVFFTYGNEPEPLHASVTFWVFPWRVLLMGLIGLVIVIFCARSYTGWRRRSRLPQA